LAQEGGVVLPAGEVPAAAQHQGLIDRPLETPVPLFDVAVLMGMVRLDLLGRHPVVGHQRLITPGELLLVGEVVHRRAHPVGTMPPRHAAQLHQRILQALAQALEALGEAHRCRLPVRVGEHEVVGQVIEALSLDGDAQVVHRGEVRGAQPARFVDLGEEYFLGRAAERPPAADVPL